MLKSGRVPCESHKSDPTMDLSSDDKLSRSLVDILQCATESTGWPDRYGVFVGLACSSLFEAIICSANAC